MGVALSILFALWFCSGIVMMYWSFPGVSERDRLERAPALDASKIKLSPEEAYASLNRDEMPTQVRLTTFDGRPVYRFSGGEGGGRGRGEGGRPRGGSGGAAVYADDGTEQKRVDDAMIDRVAAAWAARPLANAKKESIEEVDQWTVAGQLRNLRPLYKYSFQDGQQVYVSGRDAEVVQYTTTASRFWAYLGAIPHWLYFTPLRKNQPQWSQFVIWTSGIGTVASILGIAVGLWMYSPKKRYRYAGAPSSVPYRSWKRWHTIIGLLFGVMASTWAFSGMLSMGPDFIKKLSANRPTENVQKGVAQKRSGSQNDSGRRGGLDGVNIAGALRGRTRFEFALYAMKDPREAIRSIAAGYQPKEIEFTMFAGEPVYMATDGAGMTRIVPVNGEPRAAFDRDRIMELVRDAAGSSLVELRVMDEYDAYYLDRTGQRPLPVLYARLNDDTRYYIDPKTASVVGNYSTRNWVNRWLYHGLHSLDFPWLYKHRPLWDIVVIGLMLGGTALCVTSLILTYQVLKRKVLAMFASGTAQRVGVEDLA